MKTIKKAATLIIALMTASMGLNAQEVDSKSTGSEQTNTSEKPEATISADLVSNYIWRGMKNDNSAIQPTLGISYKGLSLTAWGSYGLQSDPLGELDLYLTYTIGGFSIGISDYWCAIGDDVKYFNYRNDETLHTFEANIGYDFGPVSLQWNTIFAGVDGLTQKGKRAYTSYVEANVPFRLAGLDWNATVGAVPYSANGGYYDADSDNFAVTNLSLKASKDIKITDSFSIPAFAQILANPSAQKAYFVFGITLQP